jgi:hypothetical protein
VDLTAKDTTLDFAGVQASHRVAISPVQKNQSADRFRRDQKVGVVI